MAAIGDASNKTIDQLQSLNDRVAVVTGAAQGAADLSTYMTGVKLPVDAGQTI